MAATGFEKDFGYLMPFLEKIAAAAESSKLIFRGRLYRVASEASR